MPCRERDRDPCRRPATKAVWPEKEPTLCAEHHKVHQIGEELDGWLFARDALKEFMAGSLGGDPNGALTEQTYHWLAHVTREAARSAHRLEVAKHLAAEGPQEEEEEDTIREMRAHLLVRADAFSTARAVLGGEPGFTETQRLAALDALEEAAAEVNERFDRFCAEHLTN